MSECKAVCHFMDATEHGVCELCNKPYGTKQTKVINLYGGPGLAKSTTAAGVFSFLKLHGVRSEYVSEYAKDLTWEQARKNLENQVRIFGEQQHRMWRLMGQIDVIITDSPLPLSMIYNKGGCEELNKLVLSEFNKMDNYNYILKRLKKYDTVGRMQTEEEARQIDLEVKELLDNNKIQYKEINGDYSAINIILDDILSMLSIKPIYAIHKMI